MSLATSEKIRRSSEAQARIASVLRWMVISCIIWLAALGPAIAMPPQGTEPQAIARLSNEGDLVKRVARLEALSGAAKSVDDEKASQFLAQFYTAEYSAIMARISTWASLQYALFPILLAAFAILVNMDKVPVNFRLWGATVVLLVGYLAYQGTMLDALQNVLLIERYLRPLASRLVGTDQFWIHERVYRQTHPPNIFYWKYWPPIICALWISAVMGYIKVRYSLRRHDYAWAVATLLLLVGVFGLTFEGSRLEEQIIEVCKSSHFVGPNQGAIRGRPTPTVTRTDTAPSRGPAVARPIR